MNAARAPRQVAASCSRHHAFSTSSAARSRTLPSPVPIRPASQRNTAIPANVYDLTVAYPKHPLLAFFNKDVRTIKETPEAKVGKDVLVPATLRKMDLRKDSSGRGWLAPELRTKSSLELHQLWYKCLMERNKIATTDSEIQRAGARTLVKFANYNGRFIDRRVRVEAFCSLHPPNLLTRFLPPLLGAKDNGTGQVCPQRAQAGPH